MPLYLVFQMYYSNIQSDAFITIFAAAIFPHGLVMKKRSSPKVLVYPRFAKFSYDDSYSKLLLFYPLKSEEELVTGDLRELISQTNDDNVNLVEEIER